MPYYKTGKEFEDIYYKYAYCAYNQADYMNAENCLKASWKYFPTVQSRRGGLYEGLFLL